MIKVEVNASHHPVRFLGEGLANREGSRVAIAVHLNDGEEEIVPWLMLARILLRVTVMVS